MSQEYSVIGGAGFIGSHISEALIKNGNDVMIIDNFSSGKLSHLKQFINEPNLCIRELDIQNTGKLCEAIQGSRVVIHLASNPDIAKAALEPRIDFIQGTALTESVVEAVRTTRVGKILFASGSGVYGDGGETFLSENSPLRPISTYGASKLAGEAMLASYSYMFGIECVAFRFANVVGARQTHGVGYDFLRKLRIDPTQLTIMGNGLQSKSYIHVSDVVSAILTFCKKQSEQFSVYNVSNRDSLTVNEIAEIVFKVLAISKDSIKIEYTGGAQGWKADVPIVRLDPSKIESTGWSAKLTSSESMINSIRMMNLDNFI